MLYCSRCILPDSRPGILLDKEGVCNACRNSEIKKGRIDWAGREKAFRSVVANAQSRSKGYDCVIPVSGGKDSTWQVVQCLEFGLHPLAVTWKTPARTALGEQNLRNLVSLGVDHIDYQISPKVEKKFMLQALRRHGSPAIPMHLALFNIPLTIAVRFGIPLIVWGENSAFEYGSDDESQMGFRLDSSWLRKHGVTFGTSAIDWVSDALPQEDLSAYEGVLDEELERAGVLAVFLGYYFQWDPQVTAQVAKEHGFRSRAEGPRVGYYDYADIDDDFISVHHFIKWYKFGFTRLFDNLSLEIRNGRMTRNAAVEVVRETGLQVPREDVRKLCEFLEIPEAEFWSIVEGFRNMDIWKKTNGRWEIPGFLVSDWRWD